MMVDKQQAKRFIRVAMTMQRLVKFFIYIYSILLLIWWSILIYVFQLKRQRFGLIYFTREPLVSEIEVDHFISFYFSWCAKSLLLQRLVNLFARLFAIWPLNKVQLKEYVIVDQTCYFQWQPLKLLQKKTGLPFLWLEWFLNQYEHVDLVSSKYLFKLMKSAYPVLHQWII